MKTMKTVVFIAGVLFAAMVISTALIDLEELSKLEVGTFVGTAQICSLVKGPCRENKDCCNEIKCNRENRVCYCTEDGLPCSNNLDCCRGFKCMNNICSNCMRITGPCGHDEECCSKNCSNGVCDCKKNISG